MFIISRKFMIFLIVKVFQQKLKIKMSYALLLKDFENASKNINNSSNLINNLGKKF